MRWVTERRWGEVGETWRDVMATSEAADEVEPGWETCAGAGADAEWEMGVQEDEDIEREWEDSLARMEVEDEEGRAIAFGDG